MRSVRFLLYFIIGLLLGANFSLAHAETIPSSSFQTFRVLSGIGGCATASYPWFSTKVEACAAHVQCLKTNGGMPNAYVVNADDPAGCKHYQIASVYTYQYTTGTGYGCPPNQGWILDGTTCYRPDCAEGQTRNSTTGLCETVICPATKPGSKALIPPDCNCPVGYTKDIGGVEVAPSCIKDGCTGAASVPSWIPQEAKGSYNLLTCSPNGCSISFDGYIDRGSRVENGVTKWYSWGTLSYSATQYGCTVGATTKASPIAAATLPTNTCGAGQVGGTVNGRFVCVSSDSGTVAAVAGPSMSESQTTITNETNPTTGEITQTKTTVVAGQSPTVSTTVYSSSGEVISETKQEAPTKTFCEENATSPMCQLGIFTDSDLPAAVEASSIYTRKYPDGISGVWDTKKAQIMASPLASLTSAFVPSLPDGTCPSWSIDMQALGFGTVQLGPPCWVFDVLRVIVILSAVFYSRRLILGG